MDAYGVPRACRLRLRPLTDTQQGLLDLVTAHASRYEFEFALPPGCSPADLSEVFLALRWAHPELLFCYHAYTGLEGRPEHLHIIPYPIHPSPEADAAVAGVCGTVIRAAARMSGGFARALALHDWLVRHADYQGRAGPIVAGAAHTLYGAILDRRCTCKGYADAFAYLCQRAGVPCCAVSGRGAAGEHAWNAVQLEDGVYHADLTWDNPRAEGLRPRLSHRLCFVPDWAMRGPRPTHSLDPSWEVPDHAGMGSNYYVRARRCFSVEDPLAESASRVARLLAAAGETEILCLGPREDVEAGLRFLAAYSRTILAFALQANPALSSSSRLRVLSGPLPVLLFQPVRIG